MTKLAFYAYDLGPGKMLKGLSEAAKERGHDVLVAEPQLRDVWQRHMIEMMRTECAAVLLGLSSHETEQELCLADVLHPHIPIIIVEDTWGSALRPKAKEFAPKAAATVIALPSEEGRGKEFGYKNPVYLGPPHHWGDSYKGMTENVPKRRNLWKNDGTRDGTSETLSRSDVLIQVTGGKGRPRQVNEVFRAIRDAALDVCNGNVVFHFAPHPGEKPRDGEEDLYREAFAEREHIYRGKKLQFLDTKDPKFSSPQRVATADLTVFGGGGPTESIAAAYARKMTAYWNVAVQQVLGEQIEKADAWFVTELGGTYPLESADPRRLHDDLAHLLSEDGREELRAAQAQHFTAPSDWDNRTKIIEYIERLIRA